MYTKVANAIGTIIFILIGIGLFAGWRSHQHAAADDPSLKSQVTAETVAEDLDAANRRIISLEAKNRELDSEVSDLEREVRMLKANSPQ